MRLCSLGYPAFLGSCACVVYMKTEKTKNLHLFDRALRKYIHHAVSNSGPTMAAFRACCNPIARTQRRLGSPSPSLSTAQNPTAPTTSSQSEHGRADHAVAAASSGLSENPNLDSFLFRTSANLGTGSRKGNQCKAALTLTDFVPPNLSCNHTI